MYMDMDMDMYMDMHAFTFVCIHAYTCTHTWTHIHTEIADLLAFQINTHAHTHYIFTYIHTYIHTDLHTNAGIYTGTDANLLKSMIILLDCGLKTHIHVYTQRQTGQKTDGTKDRLDKRQTGQKTDWTKDKCMYANLFKSRIFASDDSFRRRAWADTCAYISYVSIRCVRWYACTIRKIT